MILDTSFVIDFLKGNREAVAKMQSVIKDGKDYGITAPTIFELWSGLVSLNKSAHEKEKIMAIISKLIIYPMDRKAAELGGRIDGELIRRGQTIDAEDAMIAGIALAHNKEILTRDLHFNRIDGLKIERY